MAAGEGSPDLASLAVSFQVRGSRRWPETLLLGFLLLVYF